MKNRITDSISVQEMLEMREQGLSNREISERLDISYASVCRYIGRNPRTSAENKEIQASHDHKPVRLKTTSKMVELEGESTSFKVDIMKKTVMVIGLDGLDDVVLSKAQFLNLILEMKEVAEMLED